MSTRHFWVLPILLLSLAATAEIATRVYDRLPRLEDELALLYQARVFATGRLYADTPDEPLAFGVPFVVDLAGRRFSKYPPGQSLALAVGLTLGDPWLAGPLLGALAMATLYRLGCDLFDSRTALVAACLGLTSPFFLILTSSLMSHTAALLALSTFALGFNRLYRDRRPRPPSRPRPASVVAGLALGFGFLIRPYTTLWIAMPFAFLALDDVRRSRDPSLARYGPLVASFAAVASLLPAYNLVLTGQARASLYDLWWEWDRLGFGPDHGPYGFTLSAALAKTGRELFALTYDLHGVPYASLLLIAIVLLWPPWSRAERFLLLPCLALVGGAFFYHSGSRLYGPRYFYEALPALLLLSARGMGRLQRSARTGLLRRSLIYSGLSLLLAIDLGFFLPFRLGLLRNLYDNQLNWSATTAVQAAELQHAVVFLFADDWPAAAAGYLSNDVDLQADVIYARYLGPHSYRAAVAAYPTRSAFFWRDGLLTAATDPPPEWYPAYPTVRHPEP